MPVLSFVLVSEPVYPDPAVLVAAAADLGVPLTHVPREDDGAQVYDGGDVSLIVMLAPMPHPDAPRMPRGPFSPPTGVLAAAPAHYIVTAQGLDGPARRIDLELLRLTAAVVKASSAVAAMLGHGIMFYPAKLFADLAETIAAGEEIPPLVTVDIIRANEGAGRVSLLSHGLVRYGHEEFFVHGPAGGRETLGFLLAMLSGAIAQPHQHLPTGDTVGRSMEEQILVTRVPDPSGTGPSVIRLDLPG